MSKTKKLIMLTTLLSVLCTLVYVPWKAERSYQYNNTLYLDVGYSFLWSAPTVYVESDFDPKPKTYFSEFKGGKSGFDDIALSFKREELEAKGIKIYPSWVKNHIKVDYTKTGINVALAIVANAIIFVAYSLFKR